jgi:hypothetical protein
MHWASRGVIMTVTILIKYADVCPEPASRWGAQSQTLAIGEEMSEFIELACSSHPRSGRIPSITLRCNGRVDVASNPRSTNLQRQLAAQRRAAEQAAKQAAKQAARDRIKAYEQRRIERAAGMAAAAEQRVRELTGVLAGALSSPPPALSFDALKTRPPAIPLDLGADAHPVPAPRWQDYEPPPPNVLGRLFGGDARHARDRAAAENVFTAACESHQVAEAASHRGPTSACATTVHR